jgi:hypothetical protein
VYAHFLEASDRDAADVISRLFDGNAGHSPAQQYSDSTGVRRPAPHAGEGRPRLRHEARQRD